MWAATLRLMDGGSGVAFDGGGLCVEIDAELVAGVCNYLERPASTVKATEATSTEEDEEDGALQLADLLIVPDPSGNGLLVTDVRLPKPTRPIHLDASDVRRVHQWLLAFLGHVDTAAAVTPSEKPTLQTGGLVMELRTSCKPALLLRNKCGPLATVSLRHVDALFGFMSEHVADLSSGVKACKGIASITVETDTKGFIISEGRPRDSTSNGVMVYAADWPEVSSFLRERASSKGDRAGLQRASRNAAPGFMRRDAGTFDYAPTNTPALSMPIELSLLERVFDVWDWWRRWSSEPEDVIEWSGSYHAKTMLRRKGWRAAISRFAKGMVSLFLFSVFVLTFPFVGIYFVVLNRCIDRGDGHTQSRLMALVLQVAFIALLCLFAGRGR
ncbi:MAG: hypothetical protein WBD40_11995 [Tepidisphaeraceae bacterium]